MAEACPSFAPAWAEIVSDPEPDGEILLYPAISQLARHLGTLARTDQTAEFPAVFALIERLLTDGQSPARDLTIELVEDLQDWWLVKCNPALLAPYLGPAARRYWDTGT